jgi:hypothetical protein
MTSLTSTRCRKESASPAGRPALKTRQKQRVAAGQSSALEQKSDARETLVALRSIRLPRAASRSRLTPRPHRRDAQVLDAEGDADSARDHDFVSAGRNVIGLA